MELIVIGGSIIGAAGVLAGLYRIARTVAKFIQKIVHFLDDWRGEEGRPGVEARPGVIEQLADHSKRLAKIEHELQPNSGKSLRDRVDASEVLLRKIEATLAEQ